MIWDPIMMMVPTDSRRTVNPKTCVYWEPQNWHSQTTTVEGTELACVTYRDLFATAVVLVAQLRKDIQQLCVEDANKSSRDHADDSRSRGIPIVVAIPEGPWLPLAVLVVHVLNRTFDIASQETSQGRHQRCFAILVPLEPSEALERNRQILQDIQPRMVLGVSDGDNGESKDIDRLEMLVESVSKQNCQLLNLKQYAEQSLILQKVPPSFWDDFFPLELKGREDIKEWSFLDTIASAADFLNNDNKDISPLHKTEEEQTRFSHIVYTSGTTGRPKGCISSIHSLQNYLQVKNEIYEIRPESAVLLASALSFDPCLSDILATFQAKATLALAPRARLLDNLANVMKQLHVTHVLCTPTLWSMVDIGALSSMDQSNSWCAWKESLPYLRVVALGGEPIPKLLQQRWARSHPKEQGSRLYATYGVTEACVYQTAGEIILQVESTMTAAGQYVGAPFRGSKIRICHEDNQTTLQDVETGKMGEVVLSGIQVDALTGYWKRPELASKFVAERILGDPKGEQYHYRTGDRGILDQTNGTLRIIGRIHGEEGMVKVNGVRIELSEIEAALVDDVVSTTADLSPPPAVVESCMVQILKGNDENSTRSAVHAYIVLSEQALAEIGLSRKEELSKSGLLVTEGILLTLLRARCKNSLTAACMPNAFILLPNLPLSPTGKRDRKRLPPVSECALLNRGDDQGILLKDYGRMGGFLAETIRECLNLQTLQQEMMTTSVTLDMLGGDSLAATRIIRALYAHHHQVENTRYLGGDYGKFDGPFNVLHLIRAKSLGAYVDMLEQNNIGALSCVQKYNENMLQECPAVSVDHGKEEDSTSANEMQGDKLYKALLQAATRGQSSMAVALLHAGADPKYGDHGKRLGKVSGGFYQRKFLFHSSPLHLACKKGDRQLVEHLLYKGANCKTPDASGLFPLHLVASSMDSLESSPNEDTRRLQCVKYLLDAGAPIVMRDGNHQSILHAAARSGHSSILEYIMTLWNESGKEDPGTRSSKRFVNSLDRWYRSPVHWAILNGRIDALRTVLELGCTPTPYKPKGGRHTSVAVEYPMELCNRLYPLDCSDPFKVEKGAKIRRLLEEATAKNAAQQS